MALNPKMLEECKDIIFNKSELPESVKEPVHLAVKNLIVLEYGYKDFLSREMCGEFIRGNSISTLIQLHGGNEAVFDEWFSKYEEPVVPMSMKAIADDEPVVMSWGT